MIKLIVVTVTSKYRRLYIKLEKEYWNPSVISESAE